MKTNYEIRYAAHPEDAKHYDTARLRRDFLIEKVFAADEVNMVYSMYDRMIVGGAMPVNETLRLEAIDPLKAPHFLTRREMGIFNVGGKGRVKSGDTVFELDFKEALYLGAGDREVTFESADPQHPAKFYFNSTTAHCNYPDKKVTKSEAVVAHMGSLEGSNDRNINKMIVNQVLPTCQLQDGYDRIGFRAASGIRCGARAFASHGGLFLFRSSCSIRHAGVFFCRFRHQKVNFTPQTNDTLRIVLEELIIGMEEVVVTGYQKMDKRHSTSAITSVKASDVLVPGMTSIDQALEGRIPELLLMSNSGEVGATPRIRVRGTSTLLGTGNHYGFWTDSSCTIQ